MASQEDHELFGLPLSLAEVQKFRNQDYHKIRNNCLRDNIMLWEDPKFLPDIGSLEWKRPSQISPRASFIHEGATIHDIHQGTLNTCYLIAAMQALATRPGLLYWVVPRDQGPMPEHLGICHFRIWQFGTWYDVVVDDRLPTKNGKLIYTKSTDPHEFWPALLEKAYAKMFGSYSAIEVGFTGDAMVDFSGGISEKFILNLPPSDLGSILEAAYKKECLICCTINKEALNVAGAMSKLMDDHDYTVTRVQGVTTYQGDILLVRMRNPWGYFEWTGPWSDRSDTWHYISEETRQQLGLVVKTEGEFWMSIIDLKEHFSSVTICHLTPDTYGNCDNRLGRSKKWRVETMTGKWVRGVSAGGNRVSTINQNPQYRIRINEADDGDRDGKCSVVVSLIQKNKARAAKWSIGFRVYRLEFADQLPTPLDSDYFEKGPQTWMIALNKRKREVVLRHELIPGVYCIVPCTFGANEEAEFLLRVFTEKGANMVENDDRIGLQITQAVGRTLPIAFLSTTARDSIVEVEESEQDFEKVFRKVSSGEMEIDWRGLKSILDHESEESNSFLSNIMKWFAGIFLPASKNTSDTVFSKEMCRRMVAMMDQEQSGKLGLEEFQNLWTHICQWRLVFKRFKNERNSMMAASQLREATATAGYTVNSKVLNVLVDRYSDENGQLTFDDFVMCAIDLQTALSTFKDSEINQSKAKEFTLSEWVEKKLLS